MSFFGQSFKLLSPKNENEIFHNHPLTEEGYKSLPEGRFNSLSTQDINNIKYGVENKVRTKLIQKSISKGKLSNALKRSDIDNLRYRGKSFGTASNPTSAGTEAIQYVRDKDFVVEYICHKEKLESKNTNASYLEGLFLASKEILERARTFPEVCLIDAT